MPGTDFLQLDPAQAPANGLADWLTAALRAGMADGRLPVGTQLPSTRGLADQLGLSRGVVVEAYQRLADEGLVGGRRGGGTTVLTTARPTPHTPTTEQPSTIEIDLSPGVPDLSAFPRQAWLRAERDALATTSAADAEQECSLARALELIGERWTLLVLRDCFFGVRRFTDFQSHLNISRAVLTQRLTSSTSFANPAAAASTAKSMAPMPLGS